MVKVFRIDLRHRQAMATKMAAEPRKRRSLRERRTECRSRFASLGQADDFASRNPQLALQRLHDTSGEVKVLLKEGVENVHGCGLVA